MKNLKVLIQVFSLSLLLFAVTATQAGPRGGNGGDHIPSTISGGGPSGDPADSDRTPNFEEPSDDSEDSGFMNDHSVNDGGRYDSDGYGAYFCEDTVGGDYPYSF